MLEFTIKQLAPKIWHLNFSDSYDLTIHFFRYQEFYESPNMKARNVQFVDLMENYSRKLGNGKFTYPVDWAGFNLPGEVIFKRHQAGISDPNRHDDLMYALACYIRAKENSERFYIIGTSEDDELKNTTFNHELAHGFYYTHPIYRKKMQKLVKDIPPNTQKKIFSVLTKWGYSDKFFVDETQAYLSTGLQDKMDTPIIVACREPFIKVFNQYTKGIRKRIQK